MSTSLDQYGRLKGDPAVSAALASSDSFLKTAALTEEEKRKYPVVPSTWLEGQGAGGLLNAEEVPLARSLTGIAKGTLGGAVAGAGVGIGVGQLAALGRAIKNRNLPIVQGGLLRRVPHSALLGGVFGAAEGAMIGNAQQKLQQMKEHGYLPTYWGFGRGRFTKEMARKYTGFDEWEKEQQKKIAGVGDTLRRAGHRYVSLLGGGERTRLKMMVHAMRSSGLDKKQPELYHRLRSQAAAEGLKVFGTRAGTSAAALLALNKALPTHEDYGQGEYKKAAAAEGEYMPPGAYNPPPRGALVPHGASGEYRKIPLSLGERLHQIAGDVKGGWTAAGVAARSPKNTLRRGMAGRLGATSDVPIATAVKLLANKLPGVASTSRAYRAGGAARLLAPHAALSAATLIPAGLIIRQALKDDEE